MPDLKCWKHVFPAVYNFGCGKYDFLAHTSQGPNHKWQGYLPPNLWAQYFTQEYISWCEQVDITLIMSCGNMTEII